MMGILVLEPHGWFQPCGYADGKCSGAVTCAPDPFAREVNGDDADAWLCDYHQEQRFLDS